MAKDKPQKKSLKDLAPKYDYAPYEKAGAMQLSKQPNEIKDKKPDPEKENIWSNECSLLEQKVNSVWQWRTSWWFTNWANLSIYLQPKRSIWMTQNTGGVPSPNSMNRGKQINGAIMDPTATFALRVCAAGLMSGLASPSRPWFSITASNKSIPLDDEAKAWIDEVEDRMYIILANSNFYNSFAQECEDVVAFGTAPVIIYEDEKDVFRCYNPALGEYGLTVDATNRTDGLYRRFVMTVSQIVGFFELENCPEEIRSAWAEKGGRTNTEYTIAHVIEPNYSTRDCPKIPGAFTWRETYWVFGKSSTYPLSKRGFLDQPMVCSLWTQQANDPYGRSPGMDILPDVVQLQVMTVRLAEAIEKQVRPPLIADISLKNQPGSALPGHVTYADLKAGAVGMKSMYEVNPDTRAMYELLEKIQTRIQRGLFNDVIQMFQTHPGDRRTALEASQMASERLAVFGPVVERLITESLKPRMKRIFNICMRRKLFPPMPKSLQDNIDIEFISMMVLAQKASNTGGIERISSFVGNLVAVFPEAADVLNIDSAIKDMSEMLDNPQNLLNSDDKIAKLRDARAKQQQAMQKMQAQQHVAQTANVGSKAAQNLANTDVGGGQTALNQILGIGGGGQ